MTIKIIGAGLAGLLAGRLMTDMNPTILEKQKSLPNNHHAVLRFRTDNVARATGLPFRRVRVLKGVHGSLGNPVADAASYALKVTGRLQPRSILSVEPGDRWIAPPDLVARLGMGQDIAYGQELVNAQLFAMNNRRQGIPIISTIPMPALMSALEYPHPAMELSYQTGWTIKAQLPEEICANLYATIYFPALSSGSLYRASVTGDEVMLEGVGDGFSSLPYGTIENGLEGLGITQWYSKSWRSWDWKYYPAKYQKIVELSPEAREAAKRFIMWATAEYGIYSLGRFATWRPGLLLDDLPQDIAVIRRLIEGGSDYDWRK